MHAHHALPVQLRDSLQRVREALREELSDEMRPGPWSLDVHPDEGPIPEPWEVDAELERDMKVCACLRMPCHPARVILHAWCLELKLPSGTAAPQGLQRQAGMLLVARASPMLLSQASAVS